ncbi:MAG: 50S ribosomal protein L29 [Oligoflexales bacterium]|nr:50S ribosomal protein L29 [Oligoflexales bacterium]
MELKKLEKAEIKAFNLERSLEAESSLRKALAHLRMELYTEKGKSSARVRQMKKDIAKVLTFRTAFLAKPAHK